MPTVRPWYATRPVATKHHDNTRCTEGNNIEGRNLAHGTGNLHLCRRCAELNAKCNQFACAPLPGGQAASR